MKKLISGTALALLLATGSAYAADDTAQPNAAQPNMMQPNAAPHEQAATPSDQKSAARDDAMIATLPNAALPISDYYNQSVYDNRDSKIGDVNDMLLDKSGKIEAVIVGVGGFLGVGEKNVAVPFSSLKVAEKDGSRYLVLETTKEALQTAPGYIYDSGKKVWLPATKQG
jgi:sporulation protein YlmC with PRC-barrel domain